MFRQFDPNLTNLIIGEEESTLITRCLSRLMEETGASYCMLLDQAGQVLSYTGDAHEAEIMHLGALLAGSYASSREMARILREDNFRVMVQEGAREKIFTETVDGRWLLVVVFDHQAHLGLVKVLAKRATQALSSVLSLVIERNELRRSELKGQFPRAATDTIDLIFGNDDAFEAPKQTTEKS